MSKKSDLVKNAALIGIGKICTQLLSFFLLPLYTAILSTTEYGMVDLIETYKALILYILYFQIGQALFRYVISYRDDIKKKGEVYTATVFVFVVQSVLFFVTIMIYSSITGYQYGILLSAMVISSMFAGIQLTFCHGLGDYYSFTLGSFLTAVITILLNILFVLILKLGIHGMLMSNVLANVFAGLLLFIKKRSWNYIIGKQLKLNVIIELLKYSIPLVPDALSWWAITAIDKVIISNVLGVGANGIVSVSSKFSNAFSQLYEVFNNSWTENISSHLSDNDIQRYVSDVISDVLVISISLASFLNILLTYAFGILVNKNFSQGYGLIPFFMAAALLNIARKLYTALFIAYKETRQIAKITTITAIIDILVNISLVHIVGIYAAPVSSIIAYGMVLILSVRMIDQRIKISLQWRRLLTQMFVFLLSCIPFYEYSFKPLFLPLSLAEMFLIMYCNRKLILVAMQKIIARLPINKM